MNADLLVVIVMFGLFCGGLALAGWIGESIHNYMNGGK